jgi:serine protease
MKIKFYLILALSLLFADILIAQESDPEVLPTDEKLGRTAPVLAKEIYVRFRHNALPGNGMEQSYVFSEGNALERLLPLQSSLTLKMENKQNSILSAKNAKIIELEEVLLRTFRMRIDGNVAPELFCQRLLAENKNIELAEPIYVDESYGLPDDPRFDQQTVLTTIGLKELWSQGKLMGDTNIVICICDNGVTQEHEDLTGNIAPNWGEIPGNNEDDDKNGYIDDFRGYNFSYVEDNQLAGVTHHSIPHGTGVAGVAAATTDNSRGIAGVGNKCRFFPLKAGKKSSSSVYYGYEGIIYAAIQGYSVINCSWGVTKPYSAVDQSIIDYAIERGVAVVAAAGNDGDDSLVYPAAYRGVLGVGEVDATDRISNISAYGSHVDIYVQGRKNIVTEYTIDYSSNTSGTSYSAPVISGAVGLIRAEHPELSPLQALEYVRICTDDISHLNSFYEDIIAGRLNLRKTLEFSPFDRPGIRPIKFNYSTKGQSVSRFQVGQEIDLEIDARNYLGAAQNVRFELRVARDFGDDAIDVLEYDYEIADLKRESNFLIKNFKFKIKKNSSIQSFLRVDIIIGEELFDFFLIPIIPTGETTDLGNNVIKFSVGDRSQFGYGGGISVRQGIGFKYKDKDNQMFKGGLMVSSVTANKVVSSNFGYGPERADFAPIKMHIYPNENIGIVDDSKTTASEKMNIEVKKEYTFPDPKSPMTRVKLTLKNKGDADLENITTAFYIDWDVGKGNLLNTDSNFVQLFNDALPPILADKPAAVEIAGFAGNVDYPMFGCGVYTDATNAEAQAAGIDYLITKNFTKELQMQALNSGTAMQLEGAHDISMVVGMKFLDAIKPNEEVVCYFCIGGGDTRDDFAWQMKRCLDTLLLSVVDQINIDEVRVFPQPANDELTIALNNNNAEIILKIDIIDILGNRIRSIDNLNSKEIKLETAGIVNGFYLVQIRTNKRILRKSVIISR